MAKPIKGPGILFVKAAITPSPGNPLNEEQYLHWYDDDHIAEIIETSGMPNAFRWFHVDKTPGNGKPTPECPRPYLAFYPMLELAFTQGPEFKKIRVKSDMLPGTGVCYDMADTDVGYYALVEQRGSGNSEPADDATDEEINEFFDQASLSGKLARVGADPLQQAKTVSKLEKYQRSLRFRLLHARTNAQSRILKGLSAATDEPAPEPPTWMQIHVFSAEPQTDARSAIKNDSHNLLKNAKQIESHGYRLQKAHGQKKFFKDAE
ncbi:hypothetical protein N0V90_010778 [Kalmusia sp. IMI 367209]|nr:hypothetical protein N0V90_010778 [Kalmusia sp. IMI 367209]